MPRLPLNDLTGQQFTKLTVIEYSHYDHGRYYWCCVCQCGKPRMASEKNLTSGSLKSCGCLTRKNTPYAAERNILSNIKTRCNNPNTIGYHNYGGRGITVDPLFNDFDVFIAEVGPRPSPKHSIDRIDNNKGYVPGNLRWLDQKSQCRNNRNNRMITLNGETKCMIEWCEIYGVRIGRINDRMNKLGWDAETAFNTPL